MRIRQALRVDSRGKSLGFQGQIRATRGVVRTSGAPDDWPRSAAGAHSPARCCDEVNVLDCRPAPEYNGRPTD
ncbi:MAG: hypothetical protein ACYS32_19220 [Planctomycetota bacterium]